MSYDPKFVDQKDIKTFYIEKKDLNDLTLNQLKIIASNRKDLFKGFSKYKKKEELLIFMKKRFKGKRIKFKNPKKTIVVNLRPNLVSAIRDIAKSSNEYSIGVDFQRYGKVNERMFLMRCGKWDTIKFDNFEMFGHTHPKDVKPMPSASDLMNMRPFIPEFIVAGKSGKIMIFNVEDINRFSYWRRKNAHKGINDVAFDLDKLRINIDQLKDSKGMIKPKYRNYLLCDIKGRDAFYRETGVRAYPYKKGIKIEIKDVLKVRKSIPNIPKEDLEFYHSGN